MHENDSYRHFDERKKGGAGSMYEMEFPAPEVTASDNGVTMVIALQGYADAGHAVTRSAQHLLDALDSRPIATFNNDELMDYRSRRPAVTLADSKLVDIDKLNLSLHALRDTDGRPFLLLSGPEPDLRWEAFAGAVADLADRFDVAEAISLYAAPMTVPHTRPMMVTAHGTDPKSVQNFHSWPMQMQVPGAASLQIESAIAGRGRNTVGLTAHVPHYIAGSEYPEAILRLLQGVSKLANLSLPLGAIEKDAERSLEQLADLTEENHEVAAVVQILEQQYDEEAARMQELRTNPLLDDGEVPSGDELGAEFERFLAERDSGES